MTTTQTNIFLATCLNKLIRKRNLKTQLNCSSVRKLLKNKLLNKKWLKRRDQNKETFLLVLRPSLKVILRKSSIHLLGRVPAAQVGVGANLDQHHEPTYRNSNKDSTNLNQINKNSTSQCTLVDLQPTNKFMTLVIMDKLHVKTQKCSKNC